jgi:hypothetical protein
MQQVSQLEGIGNFRQLSAKDSELSLSLPKVLAPWDAATRVAFFLNAWLELSLQQRGVLAEDLNYVVNELMENAVKYSDEGSMELAVFFEADALRLSLSHPVSALHATRYQALAQALVERDPDELFAEIIERNALAGQSNGAEPVTQSPGPTSAGLGLVTLRQNYHAELGFAFHASLVTTQVSLPWPNHTPSNLAVPQTELSL